jgi:hypothetical protein
MDIDWEYFLIVMMAVTASWNPFDATRYLRRIDETLEDLQEHFVPQAEPD